MAPHCTASAVISLMAESGNKLIREAMDGIRLQLSRSG
jgi:hypothetical protein